MRNLLKEVKEDKEHKEGRKGKEREMEVVRSKGHYYIYREIEKEIV